jgi:hypothetical protein
MRTSLALLLGAALSFAPGAAQAEEVPDAAAAAAVDPAAASPQAQALATLGALLDPKQHGMLIRQWVAQASDLVLDRVSARLVQQQSDQLDLLSWLLTAFSLAGLLILLGPFFWVRRHPGKAKRLFGYSALAALIFFIAANLFALALVLLRVAQDETAMLTNPRVAILRASFEALHENADELAALAPTLIQPTLAQIAAGSDEPVPVLLLQNIQRFKPAFAVFGRVADFFRSVSWIFEYYPALTTLVTFAFFLWNARPTMARIVRLPLSAVSGEGGGAGAVIRDVFRRIGGEFLATLLVIAALIALTLLSSILLNVALRQAVEAFFGVAGLSFLWVQISPDASPTWIFVGLSGTLFFLLLNLLVAVTSLLLFLLRLLRILRARFQDRVPLGTHKRFWKWGILAGLWLQLYPLLFVIAVAPLVNWLAEKAMTAGEEPHWALTLAAGPLLLVLLFLVLLWLLRGFRAMKLLARYRPTDDAAGPTKSP